MRCIALSLSFSVMAIYSAEFIKAQAEKAPEGYVLLAGGKTHDDSYIAVYHRVQDGILIGCKAKIMMGNRAWWLREVDWLHRISQGNLAEIKHSRCSTLCEEVGCNPVSVEMLLKLAQKHSSSKKQVRLLLYGPNGSIEKATLGNGDWHIEEMKVLSESIPKDAWIKLFK